MPAFSALSGMAMWLAISASPAVATADSAAQARTLESDAVKAFVLPLGINAANHSLGVTGTAIRGSRSIQTRTGQAFASSDDFVGPEWSFQPDLRGPRLELGALGGGLESAPFLAHVSLDWQF